MTVSVSGARPKSGVTVSQPCGTEVTLVTESGNELEAAGSETITFTGAGRVALTWYEKLSEPGAAVGPVDWA